MGDILTKEVHDSLVEAAYHDLMQQVLIAAKQIEQDTGFRVAITEENGVISLHTEDPEDDIEAYRKEIGDSKTAPTHAWKKALNGM